MLNPNHYFQCLINIVSVNAHSTYMEFLCVDLHHKVSTVGQRLATSRSRLRERQRPRNARDVSRLTYWPTDHLTTRNRKRVLWKSWRSLKYGNKRLPNRIRYRKEVQYSKRSWRAVPTSLRLLRSLILASRRSRTSHSREDVSKL